MSMPELTQNCRNSLQYPDAKQIETPNTTIDFDETLEINNRESVGGNEVKFEIRPF